MTQVVPCLGQLALTHVSDQEASAGHLDSADDARHGAHRYEAKIQGNGRTTVLQTEDASGLSSHAPRSPPFVSH